MVAIKIQAFGGMQPATDDRLLPDNAGALAKNTWMYDGKLSGMRVPKLIHTLSDATKRAAFRIPKSQTGVANLPDAYWLESGAVNASFLKGNVTSATDPRYYYTDGVNPPRYNVQSRIAAGSSDYVLGIPAPTSAPTVAIAGGVSVLTETRSYVYTRVSAYGEESPPSPPSVIATNKPDATWTVTVPAIGAIATDRNITKTRIYRTITSDQGVADLYFVAEIAVGTLTYADAALSSVIVLNENLSSQGWDPPPSLQGFVNFPNGMMIGWLNNQIWFCEPFQPHAWPAAYQLSTEFNIVGIGVYGQTAVICTEGVPYSLTGINPSGMVLSKITGLNEPCVSQGSIVSGPSGVYYSSPAGLVNVGPNAANVVTTGLVPKDKWQKLLNITRMNAAMLANAYVTFSGIGDGCFESTAFENTAFELADFTGTRSGALIELADARIGFNELTSDDPVYNVFRDVWTNEILMIIGDGVFHLDTTTNASQGNYQWRSKLYQVGKLVNFSCAKIFFEDPQLIPDGSVMPVGGPPLSTFRVYGDGNLILEQQLGEGQLASGKMFRLPAGNRYDYYQFEIEGNLLINNMQIATSPRELLQI